MRVYLIGYMFSGKTTVGRKLAAKLGFQWLDLDQVFECYYHTTIPIFFKKYGEEAFRKLEQKLLHSTADLDDVVVSTGGGTPCYFDNIQWINGQGKSVYFDVTEETLLRRAAQSKKPRPVLASMTEEERGRYIHQQLSQRLPYYQKAHVIFPADQPDIDRLVMLITSAQ
ncbi:MAG: shikimate kinase [Bacteroidales bacterium]|nr:shikimate kinase [Bacteroidales bacterium]